MNIKVLTIIDIIIVIFLFVIIIFGQLILGYNYIPFLIMVLLLSFAVYFTKKGNNNSTAVMLWQFIMVVSGVIAVSGVVLFLTLDLFLIGHQGLTESLSELSKISIPSGFLLCLYSYVHLRFLKIN